MLKMGVRQSGHLYRLVVVAEIARGSWQRRMKMTHLKLFAFRGHFQPVTTDS